MTVRTSVSDRVTDRRHTTQRQRIGPTIRSIRLQQDKTLDDLAGLSGISASHLSRLERGQTVPSFIVLAGIAQALGTSIEYFARLESDITDFQRDFEWFLMQRGVSAETIEAILGMPYPAQTELARLIRPLGVGDDVGHEERRARVARLLPHDRAHVEIRYSDTGEQRRVLVSELTDAPPLDDDVQQAVDEAVAGGVFADPRAAAFGGQS